MNAATIPGDLVAWAAFDGPTPPPPPPGSFPISGSIEAVLDPLATNLPPNHKLFECRVVWRPEIGGAHSSISAYVSAIGKRVRFHVPSDTDFKVRLKLPMPEGTSDEEVKTLELTHLARIKPEQDRDRAGAPAPRLVSAQELAAQALSGTPAPARR